MAASDRCVSILVRSVEVLLEWTMVTGTGLCCITCLDTEPAISFEMLERLLPSMTISSAPVWRATSVIFVAGKPLTNINSAFARTTLSGCCSRMSATNSWNTLSLRFLRSEASARFHSFLDTYLAGVGHREQRAEWPVIEMSRQLVVQQAAAPRMMLQTSQLAPISVMFQLQSQAVTCTIPLIISNMRSIFAE